MDPSLEQMTTAEKILYVQELWDKIAAEFEANEMPLTTEQAEELDRRIQDYRASPEASVPWEAVRDQMTRRD